MEKQEKFNVSKLFNVFIEKITTLKPEISKLEGFPTFVGEVTAYKLRLYDIKMTMVTHIQKDEKEFVVKVFLSHNPQAYFEGTKGKKKIFSKKGYRQNEPCIFKIIYHAPAEGKENWIQSQLPEHTPGIDFIAQGVWQIQDVFLQARSEIFG